MLFQSYEFLILLLVAIFGIAILRRARSQHVMLLVLSYIFYGWWDVRFLHLLCFSSVVDYTVGMGIRGLPLSWKDRVKLSGVVALATAAFLGINWPAMQFHKRLDLATLLAPDWHGWKIAVACSLGYVVLSPFVFGLMSRLDEPKRKRAFLITSLCINLGILGFFKYANFFANSLNGFGNWLGFNAGLSLPAIALPVGISFYTFQSMSYAIDVYRGTIEPERSLLRFMTFVSYFPQLVAGPIIRPQTFLPTLKQPWELRADRLTSGFHLCLVGLFKKLLIADQIAPLADNILNMPEGRPSLAIQLGSLLFAAQVYCDFSGYSDIARGVSRIFGVEIPLNFNYPYFATSIGNFWRRWHISLSSWLRDYLYIPLGGSRGSTPRVWFNLMATMFIAGLWHGAGWNYVLYGVLQGVLLIVGRQGKQWIDARPVMKTWFESRLGTLFRWAMTMYLMLFGFVVFRSPSLPAMWSAVKSFVIPDGILSLSAFGLGTASPATAMLAFGVFVVLHTFGYWLHLRDSREMHATGEAAGRRPTLESVAAAKRWPDWLDLLPQPVMRLAYTGLGAMFFLGWPNAAAPFIYFQF